LLRTAADLADQENRFRPLVLLEQFKEFGLHGADDRVAADADARRLRIAHRGELEHRFIGERAAAADDADSLLARSARLGNVAGHDTDLALAGSNHTGAVWADEPHAGLRLEEALRAGHVENRNALSDGDDGRDAGVSGLHDRVGGPDRRNEHHAGVRAGLLHRLGHRVEHRQRLLRLRTFPPRAALLGRDPADELRAVEQALIGVKRAGAACNPLTDYLGVRIDQNAHDGLSRKECEYPQDTATSTNGHAPINGERPG